MQGQRREEGHMGSVGPYARLCGIPGGGRWRGHSLRRLVAPKSGWREKVMRNIADRALLVRYLGFFFAENLSLFPKNYIPVIYFDRVSFVAVLLRRSNRCCLHRRRHFRMEAVGRIDRNWLVRARCRGSLGQAYHRGLRCPVDVGPDLGRGQRRPPGWRQGSMMSRGGASRSIATAGLLRRCCRITGRLWSPWQSQSWITVHGPVGPCVRPRGRLCVPDLASQGLGHWYITQGLRARVVERGARHSRIAARRREGRRRSLHREDLRRGLGERRRE